MNSVYRYLGVVSALALLLAVGSAAAQTGPSPELKAWFEKEDKNHDGALDHAEFQHAVVEMFYFRDKNKNGYLTIEELRGASPEAVKAASRTHDNRLNLDEYLNALFKDFAAADTNGDGKLTLEEIDAYIRTNRQ